MMIKSGMTWAGHVAHMGFGEKPGHLEDLGTDGKRIIKWMLKRKVGRVWYGFLWLRIGITSGLLQTW
jgi:hypothetical protein